MTNSQKLVLLCLSFIGGICFASYFFALKIFIIGLIMMIDRRSILIGLCVICFSFGCFLVENEVNKINQNPLLSFHEKEIILTGTISKEVKQKDEKTEIILGDVLIFTDKYSFLKYGDEIRAKGTLRIAQKIDGFDYQGYLAKSGVVGTMAYPKIELISSNSNALYDFKEKSSQKIRDLISPSVSPILEAMILGNSGKINKETRDILSKSGTSHIVAISGMHIVIFSTMIFWLLINLGLWRKQALALSIFFIFLYVFFVGCPASALRAGIMVSFLFIAEIFDRKSFNLRTLVLTATILLLFNPLLLKYDLGFQLSFLAVLGIILTSSTFNNWFSFIKWKKVREIVSATAGAQIFSLPILISSFGYFSLVSFFTNLLILPILSVVMILGILMVLFPFGFILSIPCSLLLFYLLAVVTFFSQLPFATASIPVFIILLLYIPLIYFIYKSNKKELEFLGQ
ncbi:MAG: competence protein ComEC [Patescibacteria group bacterium]|nr:competence protein ComEC [Patescibacteria group bacterium]